MNDVDLGQLLTIDVGSELRKLSSAQLQGPWQIPAEIVRRALRGGATKVEVGTTRSGVNIVDDGAPIPLVVLEATAALLQPNQSNEVRHTALTTLELAGGLALLAVAGLSRKKLRIEVDTAEAFFVLEAGNNGARLQRHAPKGHRRNVVRVTSPELDRKQVQHWLGNVGRFCPTAILVDGRPLRSGWRGALVHGSLSRPLPGRIAIPREGETSHVWLLEHGIITGHLTVPDAPCFEAAVELGSAATDLSAARLREEVTPHLGAIVESAVELSCRLGPHVHKMSEAQRIRVARSLLSAARRRVRADVVVQVPIFRVLERGQPRLASLVELRGACTQGPGDTRTLLALYPSQNRSKFALGDRLTLVADATERSGLAEVLSLRFRPPTPREGGRSIKAELTRLAHRAGRAASRVAASIRSPLGGRTLTEHEYSAAERRFIELLRTQLAQREHEAPTLHLCEGRGPVRGGGSRGPLLMPRHNPTVLAAIAAVCSDERWAYPAALAMLQGNDLPTARARLRWRNALG